MHIPEIPSPAPKSKKILCLHGQPQKETAMFNGSDSCGNNTSCHSDEGGVLAGKGGGEGTRHPGPAQKGGLSRRGGGGDGTGRD